MLCSRNRTDAEVVEAGAVVDVGEMNLGIRLCTSQNLDGRRIFVRKKILLGSSGL
jgi:hypothetical protein